MRGEVPHSIRLSGGLYKAQVLPSITGGGQGNSQGRGEEGGYRSRCSPSVALWGGSRLESSEWQQWFGTLMAQGLSLASRCRLSFEEDAKQAGPKWLKICLGYF